MAKINKQNIQHNNNLTEDEKKYKRISIVGSIVLAVLIVALISSILIVYFTQKSPEKSIPNPLENTALITEQEYDKMYSNKSTNIQFLEFENEQTKKEFGKNNPQYIYILFHSNNVNDKLKEKYLKLSGKDNNENNIYLSLHFQESDEETEKITKKIKEFYAYINNKQVDKFTDEENKLFKDKKLFLLKIDFQNFNKNDANELFIDFNKIAEELNIEK